ncbi:hypothetical protein OH76DRAFT_1420994 [Lentinus brumalis]|uniref:Uncharacterized protein n=1 Tax=Lentinus brumalis TaxID=2498619 RepID=A0A371CXV4_9APHY|nr:hypothetical protein OH76DRAFT_1420994 [Polyporus brumalis]
MSSHPSLSPTIHRDTHLREPTKVYARWIGYCREHSRSLSQTPESTHVYSASILPERPLKIGMRVRILATSPAWYSGLREDQDAYEVYDAHVVGAITGVVGWKGRKVVLEIANECAVNRVKSVRLRIPFAPEATVQLYLDDVRVGRREAQEADLNTTAEVRSRPDDPRCDAAACAPPWRKLVGESFLWEPMVEDVGERPGDPGGRRKVPKLLMGWTDLDPVQEGRCFNH